MASATAAAAARERWRASRADDAAAFRSAAFRERSRVSLGLQPFRARAEAWRAAAIRKTPARLRTTNTGTERAAWACACEMSGCASVENAEGTLELWEPGMGTSFKGQRRWLAGLPGNRMLQCRVERRPKMG